MEHSSKSYSTDGPLPGRQIIKITTEQGEKRWMKF